MKSLCFVRSSKAMLLKMPAQFSIQFFQSIGIYLINILYICKTDQYILQNGYESTITSLQFQKVPDAAITICLRNTRSICRYARHFWPQHRSVFTL